MSGHQRIVLSELMNHTDWDKYSDFAALDYLVVRKTIFFDSIFMSFFNTKIFHFSRARKCSLPWLRLCAAAST